MERCPKDSVLLMITGESGEFFTDEFKVDHEVTGLEKQIHM